MDKNKTGSFIAACRKAKGFTQATLAEKLGITDRAISKWETGKCLPDASLMPELCEYLEISVNELLTGERLNMEVYKNTAEENLIELTKQEEINNRKLLTLENVIGYTCSVSFMVMIFAASFAVTNLYWRIALIAVGAVIFGIGMYHAVRLEHDAGYYDCPNCHKKYVPTMRSVVMAPHIGRSRKMKCPYCGEKGYHKKVLTK